MARLTRLPGRIAAMPSRVKVLPKRAEGFYASAEWKAYRERHRAWTVQRQGGVWCAVCGSTKRLILDHVVERRDGGADFPPFEGARWLCGAHHNAKTAAAKKARAQGEAGGGQKSAG